MKPTIYSYSSVIYYSGFNPFLIIITITPHKYCLRTSITLWLILFIQDESIQMRDRWRGGASWWFINIYICIFFLCHVVYTWYQTWYTQHTGVLQSGRWALSEVLKLTCLRCHAGGAMTFLISGLYLLTQMTSNVDFDVVMFTLRNKMSFLVILVTY